MKPIVLPNEWQGESCYFIEGAVLASNLAVKPLEPESWGELAGIDNNEMREMVVPHINQQHNILQRSEYSLSCLDRKQLADMAEGFMTIWPVVEEQYGNIELLESSARMLQALLTTFMLAIDEKQTQQQMLDSGITEVPALEDMLPRIDLMVTEVALAADEQMVGAKSQSVNPYKSIGRNDLCPCGSEKKFKQCCGK